ncbi:MAG: metal-dependent transcriptional regulator [Nitrososphaeria archaeon]
MNRAALSKRERDYLVTIFRLSEEFPVRVKDVADAFGVKEPTAYEYAMRLKRKNLLVLRRGVIKLTEKGEIMVGRILKAHRVLEIMFVMHGLDARKSCEECSKIDYLMDDESVDRLYEELGRPERCPHGEPVLVRSG